MADGGEGRGEGGGVGGHQHVHEGGRSGGDAHRRAVDHAHQRLGKVDKGTSKGVRRGDAHLKGGRQVAVAVGEDAGKIVLSRKRCLRVKILFKTTDRGLTQIIAGAVVVADGGHHRQVDIVVGGCLVKRLAHLFQHL